jgi:hypothetical protein
MRRVNPEQMARWLARGQREDWSPAELARRSRQPAWKLRWWRKRFERTRTTAATGGAFVAVELADPAPSPSATLEVTTPTGYRVQVPAHFDPEHLRRLLRALEAPC